jgi:hypothetical protein
MLDPINSVGVDPTIATPQHTREAWLAPRAGAVSVSLYHPNGLPGAPLNGKIGFRCLKQMLERRHPPNHMPLFLAKEAVPPRPSPRRSEKASRLRYFVILNAPKPLGSNPFRNTRKRRII